MAILNANGSLNSGDMDIISIKKNPGGTIRTTELEEFNI